MLASCAFVPLCFDVLVAVQYIHVHPHSKSVVQRFMKELSVSAMEASCKDY